LRQTPDEVLQRTDWSYESETEVAEEESNSEGGRRMTDKELASRQKKAVSMIVKPVGGGYAIESSTGRGGYMVTVSKEGRLECSCPDYYLHRGDSDWVCKHLIAVETFRADIEIRPSGTRYDAIDI